MILVPGSVVAAATFPGVVLHELAHEVACRLVGLRVYEVVYFRLGNPAGYVVHEPPRRFGQALAVSMFPLVLNTVVAFLFAVAALEAKVLGWSSLYYVLLWLSISSGMHAIPSTGDAKGLWRYSRMNWRREKKALLGLPIAGIVYLLALASVAWADLLYALAIVYAASRLLGVPF